MSNKKIEISYKTIVFTVLFLIGLFVLWQVRALIILMFISFIFMEVLNPAIVKLEKYKIPRPLAILIVYLIIIAIVSLTIAGIVPILVQQTSDLIKTLPETLEDINIFGTNAIDWSSQLKVLENLPSSIAKTAVSLVSNIMSGFVIMFLTFYMLLEKKNFSKYGLQVFGTRGNQKFMDIVEKLEKRLGSWVTAEFFLMTIIGVMSYIGYTLLGLNYAVPLAIFAGLLEAIPSIGPTVTTIVASLVGFTTSPLTGFLTIGFGIIIQQLENNIIVPKVMKQTVGFNPLVTILLIAAGAKLGGVVGAILALPIFLTIQTVFEVLIPRKNK
ncbi:MAG TPA: AI-2E family transporter [Candidatus Woesebacteria bacterium]|jgi:predicted PurR-regulated permease PerM|nr:AI-2E family transporter [Candidatus Shapirobacteria bacterium]HOR01813.1 AI-2E family transporter [Candidatus Woesebacteria bacterium]